MRQLTSTELKRLHREQRRGDLPRLSLILDAVQGPFNVGGIIRTAACYRVDHIWFADTETTPRNPKVAKTALGTDRYVTWAAGTAAEAVAAEKAAGARIVAVELADGAEPAEAADLSGDICLVIGHEDRGVSKTVLAECDAGIYLPQLGKVGSLNVATAASIAIWEVRRRSW
ncbi:MAG: TrmH family RNA methyltransferase [Acidimicrobiales bacterium]